MLACAYTVSVNMLVTSTRAAQLKVHGFRNACRQGERTIHCAGGMEAMPPLNWMMPGLRYCIGRCDEDSDRGIPPILSSCCHSGCSDAHHVASGCTCGVTKVCHGLSCHGLDGVSKVFFP